MHGSIMLVSSQWKNHIEVRLYSLCMGDCCASVLVEYGTDQINVFACLCLHLCCYRRMTGSTRGGGGAFTSKTRDGIGQFAISDSSPSWGPETARVMYPIRFLSALGPSETVGGIRLF